MTDTAKRESLLRECKVLAENSLYAAQAHFVIARQAVWRTRLFLLVPAVVAAVSGILTSVGLPGWIGAFGSAAALVIAVATFLGADRMERDHKTAGNLFTCLRHEARSLDETFHLGLTDEQLLVEVRRLSDRYSSLAEMMEVTDQKAYAEARRRIKSGTFKPDFRDDAGVGAK